MTDLSGVPTQPVGSRSNPRPRRGGRVLLVDGADRLLLVRGSDPGRPGSRYWFTVGGGVEPGETVAQAAARELREETGLAVTPAELGAPILADVTEFPYEGTWYRQEQSFFVLRVASWDVPTEELDPAEAHYIHEHRWWSVADLETTEETVYPSDLAQTLRRILVPGIAAQGGAPAGPQAAISRKPALGPHDGASSDPQAAV